MADSKDEFEEIYIRYFNDVLLFNMNKEFNTTIITVTHDLGTHNTVLIECKKQARSVERDEVSSLYDKVKSLGAQKGILISTAGFQSGAVQYAKVHGIALWQICDNLIKHISNSIGYPPPDMIKYQFLVEQYLPKHFMMEWDCEAGYPYTQIYPTEEMLKNARERAKENYYA